MRTSSSRRALILESAVAATAVLAISTAIWPETLGLTSAGLHPGWIAIIALAARYGSPGLFVGLPLIAAPLVGVSYLESGGDWLLRGRASAQTDLIPIITAVAVAWITISHQSRQSRLAELLDDAEREQQTTQSWADALEASLGYLRDRCDRIDVSLSFWRRVAEGLERGDVRAAATAALELCMTRTGAAEGCIVLRRSPPELVARSGGWTAADLACDATVRAAVAANAGQVAHGLAGATAADSDVAVPIADRSDGAVLGVIALRGVDPAQLKRAEISDLELIGDWLSPAVARRVRGAQLRSVTGELG